MTDNAQQPRPGSLRSILGGLVSLLLTRAELFGLEAQEQKEALLFDVLTGVAALIAFLVGLQALLLFIMVLSPEPWRALVLGLLAVVFLLGGTFALYRMRRRLHSQPAPFSVTLNEVRKDWEILNEKGSS
ncbi:phage holin family protein [Crenobacter sp. SG2303]|uniref:Phage holin family protein n=1 Tax=Crenobacter oryzisoli TaxID=3056844 RepID=A0ABT7XNZ3_9NEIS|nr:phage holin family protein [Crenobacter sp. SG2303]MDN0075475.1 phage holin family protein [Crenobacter sp. SG2303]